MAEGKLFYTKKVVKPILGTPASKNAGPASEISNQKDSKRRSTRIASKPKSDLTMEQQATALLMRKCGVLAEGATPDKATEAAFQTRFVEPMVTDTISSYRETFGLPEEGGVDALAALVINAEA